MRKKIGECLIQGGLISESDLQVALAEHRRTGERLGAVLIRLNIASEQQIAKALAYQLGFPYHCLGTDPPDPSVVGIVPREVALKRVCVAVRLEKNLLTVAMADPLLFSLIQDLEFQTGYRIRQVVAPRTEILEAIAVGYADQGLVRVSGSEPAPPGEPLAPRPADDERPGLAAKRRADEDVFEPTVEISKDKGESAPIIDLVDLVIRGAIASGASDVHVEPMETSVLVRHRLDGLLKEVMELPKWAQDGLTARLKIMAGMDIAEKRLPQDGRIRVRADDDRDVDFRASSLKTLFGEKIVLRVLDQRKGAPPLEDLGLLASGLERLRFLLRHQHGMILVVGPTGSGKTTTLSSAIASIKSTRTNIVTIEDPIEYQIAGVNQTQVNEKVKLTFASSLRAILRQDPDVILVGEIRDHETVKIALQAALTGHLVLSTLHTEDAPSAVARLLDMGAEPYIIASAVLGVVAQRLVRRLCPTCSRPYRPSAEVLRALNLTEAEAASIGFHSGIGCEACHQTGYRGRIGIYEVMSMTDKMRRLVSQRAGEDALREAAVEGGLKTLGDDGVQKIRAGLTTPDEVLRVVTEVRDARTLCPGCTAPVGLDFVVCPYCARRLSGGCPRCGRAIQSTWELCPFCTTALVAGASRAGDRAPAPAGAEAEAVRTMS